MNWISVWTTGLIGATVAGCVPEIRVVYDDAATDVTSDALDAMSDGGVIGGDDGPRTDLDHLPDTADESSVDVADVHADVPQPVDAPSCTAPLISCGGACVDATRSIGHCGRCGNDCAALPRVIPGNVRCEAGACVVDATACVTGWARCSADVSRGCETNLATVDQCGACGTRCGAATPVCAGSGGTYSCVSGCSGATPTSCGGSCVDTRTSALHCGACGAACPTGAASIASCVMGTCRRQCVPGFHLCGDGCVDNLSPLTCGAACLPCMAPVDGAAACDGARCGLRCNAGFALRGMNCVRPAAPRPIGPISPATTASRRPTFRWSLADGTDGAHVTVCGDRACTRVSQEFDAVGTSGQPPTPLATGPSFWRLQGRSGAITGTESSPTWELIVVGNAPREATWGSLPDFNGDGRAELVTSAIFVDGGRGRIYAYHAPRFAGGAPNATINSPLADAAAFGGALAAGDIDGDGFVDLIVGAPLHSFDNGQVVSYRGSSVGIATGYSLIANVAIGEGFGSSVSSAGDFNGDGYGDVLVGAPRWNSGSGRAYIYFGSPSGLRPMPAMIFDPMEGPDASCGFALAGAGDLNGDGLGDVAIGCPGAAARAGAISVYLGTRSSTPLPRIRLTPTGGEEAGGALAALGDVDGDGLPELGIGVRITPGRGRVLIHRGTTSGIDSNPAYVLQNPNPAIPGFSWSLSGGADVDGDGLCDVVVGAPAIDTVGNVYLYSGRFLSSAAVAVYTISGPMRSYFGGTTVLLGDTDGDNLSEVAIGAFATELPVGAADSTEGRGHVFIARGGTPPSPTFAATLRGPDAAPAAFGAAFAR